MVAEVVVVVVNGVARGGLVVASQNDGGLAWLSESLNFSVLHGVTSSSWSWNREFPVNTTLIYYSCLMRHTTYCNYEMCRLFVQSALYGRIHRMGGHDDKEAKR